MCDPDLNRLFYRLWAVVILLAGVMLVAAAYLVWRITKR